MSLRSRLIRGFSVVAAFLCAVCLGAEAVASSGDYKGMVDSMLGGVSAKSASNETYAYTSDYDNLADMLTQRVRIAEQLSEEGAVLLKNDGALPLGNGDEVRHITMLGNRPYTYAASGTLRDTRLTFYGGITGSRVYEQSITTADGTVIDSPVTMETALAAQNIVINPEMKNFYSNKPYSPLPAGSESADAAGGAYSIDEPAVTLGDTGDYASYDDAAIVVLGRSSGEGRDYLPGASGVKQGATQSSALGLSDEERNLIDVADAVSHGNVIVLLNSAVAMEIDELKEDTRVNAILWIGLPGAYGLGGVARLISGSAAPSGSLPDEYAVSASHAPAAMNFGDGNPDGTAKFTWSNGSYTSASNGHYVVMAEGIYTGYYYYETRYFDTVTDSGNADSAVGASGDAGSWRYENEVSYPFGYGLSYTTFTQKIMPDSFAFNTDDKTVSVNVEVENTGLVAAKNTVQLYVQSPYTDYDRSSGVEKSAIQLITFAKTRLLAPGEQETVTLTADIKYFASYDRRVAHDGVTGGYIMEAGAYRFAVGNGAHEALNNIMVNELGLSQDDLYLEAGSAINAYGSYSWDITDIAAFNFDANGVDSAYFAASEAGTVIRNQMPDTDYNYFNTGTEVTYLSRTDWQGTFPRSYTGLPTVEAMHRYLQLNASVHQFGTVGELAENVQFGVDHTEDYDENTGVPLENTDIASYKGKAYDAADWDYLLQQISFDEAWQFAPLGGTKCKAFTSVNAPEVWQIDGPNGNVTRGYATLAPTSGEMAVAKSDANANYMSADMPCAPTIAATFNVELLEEEGEIFGEDTLWSRNPIMWAPGMNLHRTQFNSRNHEYYSEDPILTNLLGVSFVRGGLKKGAILSAKHFAFNTQESYREGLSQFFDEQTGREMELRAFQGLSEDIDLLNASGNRLDALGLMSSFSRAGICGVNAHTGIMKNVLRGEWGFKGLISTDMVSRTGFFNPQDSVVNNVTFMATSSGESFLQSSDWANYNNKQLVRSDPLMMNALYENMHYYMYAIANSSALNGYAPGDTLVITMSWWQRVLIGVGATMGVIALGLIALYTVFAVKKTKYRTAGGEPALGGAAEETTKDSEGKSDEKN